MSFFALTALRTKKRNEHWSLLGKQTIKFTTFQQAVQQAAEKEQEVGDRVTEHLKQQKITTSEDIERIGADVAAIEARLAQLPVFERLA